MDFPLLDQVVGRRSFQNYGEGVGRRSFKIFLNIE
jgi:hypothetical protein